jgi:carbamoyltransferase
LKCRINFKQDGIINRIFQVFHAAQKVLALAAIYYTGVACRIFGSCTRLGARPFYLYFILKVPIYILGISAYYHDSAACLISDGVIVAAVQEERFTRIKNDASFPENSIKYCLEYAEITLCEISHVVYYEKPFLKFERLLETHLAFAPFGIKAFLKSMPVWLKEKLYFKRMLIRALQLIDPCWMKQKDNLLFAGHHQSHAASAFYPSPFQKAVILTADGVGEWETTSVSLGEGNSIKPVCHINFPHSIGLLYSAFTYYLGFKVNCDEYKVMGLAPYGKPVYSELILKNLIDVKSDGSFRLNMNYFNYATGMTMTSGNFEKLFSNKRRIPGNQLMPFHMDVAASIQKVTEDVMLKITTSLHKKYGWDNLCLAGGVALNCVANGKILKQSGFKNIWIQPAAGDAGGALGAALAVYYQHLNQTRNSDQKNDGMQNSLFGPAYQDEDIKNALNNHNLAYEQLSINCLYPTVAAEIADGKVVGYFRGRMEYGPRALGARSILADPRIQEMQSILNRKIKFRESFRPFAPAVLEEHASTYFDLEAASPYMLLVAQVREEKRMYTENALNETDAFASLNQSRSVIPAITHIDYSSRLQTVNALQHADFHKLITAFYNLTGCPMVINTSFNRMDEPIVCTPSDAIECFLNTGMDVLVIENFIVRKIFGT